jgi:hypothetical protein
VRRRRVQRRRGPAAEPARSPGDYPVQLVIAELPQDLPFGNDRCAFVVVTFDAGRVYWWESVTAVAPAGSCFTGERPHAFLQEGATGIFSPEAGAAHFARLKEGFDRHLQAIRSQATRFGVNDWVNYRPGRSRANVILCEGGFGDGWYECFVGMTREGRVARLVIDFDIAAPAGA